MVDFTDEDGVKQVAALIGDAELPPVETAAQPFVGVTTDGLPVYGLDAGGDGFNPAPAINAASAYLRALDTGQRKAATLPLDAPEIRMWSNAFLTFPEHGLLLQELSTEQRLRALAVIEATLSARGFAQMREAMRLNAQLGHFVQNYEDTLTEWCYWFTIFGDPQAGQAWGWQLAGHHIDLHAVIVDGHLVVTPAFLGCEFEAHTIFHDHRHAALTLMDGLGPHRQGKALLHGSMLSAELPAALAGMVDGRHRAGAGRDNLILPYAGVRGDAMSSGERELLRRLLNVYVTSLPTGGPRESRIRSIENHLDETYLAWIGRWDEKSPFYYRVHSPVVLIEYDNHPGIFLDNDEPEPFHVHTIVRTPNGGDYAKNLLRNHYHRHHGES
ncbi:DUF3500 domain-containing protein [Mycobacterium sp. 1245852.3]|uniref:DUF3500 domain-containing protein n=1 Tax=Mycobacterium sp. 1245852.3 TaxID=1856860 RepID=UPI0007FC5372|nr:DUF3500 domain-containing protein [Mycobacterium sp. 1245852.3]OBJ83293.1 hypothetical protein A9W96_27910 [Mycobacterium sp. 1245852.3]